MARPRKFDETEVLAAARAQFWQRGYDGTSMSDLCGATGVAPQSLYGAFGSKHELFVRTLDDYCARQVDGLAATRVSGRSAWDWLLAAVTFDDGGRVALGPDGCYLSSSTTALSRLDEDVRAASRRTYDRILDLFAAALQDARDTREVRADIDVDAAALALVVAMQGIEFLRKSGIDDARFERAKRATVAGLTAAYAAPEAAV